MTDWRAMLPYALGNGLMLSLMLTLIAALGGAIAPDMFLPGYPPDIRERYGAMSRRAARLRPYVATLLFLTALVVPLLGLFRLRSHLGTVGFWQAFAYAAVSMLVFNILDLLILDWLLFCTLRPRAMTLPGTEGMAGYRDYGVHVVGFLKGLGFTVGGGLVVAVLWATTQWLMP